MAVVIHTRETLGDTIRDLEAIIQRLAELRDEMEREKIDQVAIDYHKMQTNGRVWLHRFAADGRERLRAAVVARELERLGESPNEPEPLSPTSAERAKKPKK